MKTTMRNVLARHGYKFKIRDASGHETWERSDGFQATVVADDEVLAHDGNPDPVAAGELRFYKTAALDRHLAKIKTCRECGVVVPKGYRPAVCRACQMGV